MRNYRSFQASIAEAFNAANHDVAIPNTEMRNNIRKAMSALQNNLHIAECHLTDLGSDARAYLRSATRTALEKDSRRTRQWTGTKSVEDISANKAIEKATEALSELTVWAGAARKAMDVKSTKTPNTAAENLAYQLAVIWTEQTGEYPPVTTTDGYKDSDFFELCGLAFRDLWGRSMRDEAPKAATYAPEAIRLIKKSDQRE